MSLALLGKDAAGFQCPRCAGPADAAVQLPHNGAMLCRCDACGGFDGDGAWRACMLCRVPGCFPSFSTCSARQT